MPGELILASSAEDNLLWKLRWYRKGGEVSDQQWRDVLGLLRVSGAAARLTTAPTLECLARHHLPRAAGRSPSSAP